MDESGGGKMITRKDVPFFLMELFIALVLIGALEFAIHRQDQKIKKLKTAGLVAGSDASAVSGEHLTSGFQLQVSSLMSTEAADVVCYVDLASNEIHLSPGHGWKECAQRESETLIRSGRPSE
jgi:hypothetical protein